MTSNNRFANRETVVKGFIINLAEQTQTPFEVKTQYTRSNEKAVAFARKTLEIEDNPQIIVAVTEIENEAPKPVKYNEGKVYERAITRVETEAEAENLAEKYNARIRKIAWYEISGFIWYTTNYGDYGTTFFKDETPVNMTKCDARAFVALSYEMANDDCKVIGVHDVKKTALDLYCVIDETELAKCIEA